MQRRTYEPKTVLVSNNGHFRLEVEKALNQWCVSVYRVSDNTIVAQDFFGQRWIAENRARDFLAITNKEQ